MTIRRSEGHYTVIVIYCVLFLNWKNSGPGPGRDSPWAAVSVPVPAGTENWSRSTPTLSHAL